MSFEAFALQPQTLDEAYAQDHARAALEHEQWPDFNNTYYSARLILDAADLAIQHKADDGTPSRALILGAGAQRSVSIGTLAKKFDEVVIVDRYEPGLDAALAEIERADAFFAKHPEADASYLTRHKMRAITADLSYGLADGVTAAARQALGIASDFDAYTNLFSRLAATTTAHAFPKLDGPYDFVSSHHLVSEMVRVPQQWCENMAAAEYGKEEMYPDSMALHSLVFSSLRKRLLPEHMADLVAQTKPGGVIQISDENLDMLPAAPVTPLVEGTSWALTKPDAFVQPRLRSHTVQVDLPVDTPR
ncbi:MAG TPA: hypothetical protein VD735_06895 [Candidatus Saccharimonadales bacterium]|nr:hypothetical protein [Candidatus Saccharimonadales bacterium]